MRKKSIREGFVDGILSVYENKDSNKSTFGAVKNALKKSDMEFIVKLRYNIRTKRESDLEFAESNGRKLDLKVITTYHKAIQSMQYVITDDAIYTLYDVDYDMTEKSMYLYLEEVRKL